MAGLRLIEWCAEFMPKEEIEKVPHKIRGIYALLQHDPKHGSKEKFEVVYIGMSCTGIRGRLEKHSRSKKAALWNYFSMYAVWPNITDDEIKELEGLFRAIYRRDSTANKLAVQKNFTRLRALRIKDFSSAPQVESNQAARRL